MDKCKQLCVVAYFFREMKRFKEKRKINKKDIGGR